MKIFVKNVGILLMVFLSISVYSFEKVTSENRERILKEIIDNLSKEKYDDVRKDFHSTLLVSLPSERISEVWQSTVEQSGIFESILSIKFQEIQGYIVGRARCRFEEGNLTIEATFNEDDKVIGLYIKP